MTSLLTVSAMLLAWLGAAAVIVSDGRRAIAFGLSLTGVGLAGLALLAGDSWGGVALLAGGLGAGALRLRDGTPGWRIMPLGSTPRIILSLVGLAAGALVGVYLVSGPDAPRRVAALAVCGLSLARLVTADRRAAGLGAACALSLALGTFGGLDAHAVGAAVAVALSALPTTEALEGADSARAGPQPT
jgi:hypothetical protein